MLRVDVTEDQSVEHAIDAILQREEPGRSGARV